MDCIVLSHARAVMSYKLTFYVVTVLSIAT